jgi:hypothetical protein
VRFEALTVGVALALLEYQTYNKNKPDKFDTYWVDEEDFRKLTTTDASNNSGKLRNRIEYVKNKIYIDNSKYFS